jgi:hypothetical protein
MLERTEAAVRERAAMPMRTYLLEVLDAPPDEQLLYTREVRATDDHEAKKHAHELYVQFFRTGVPLSRYVLYDENDRLVGDHLEH